MRLILEVALLPFVRRFEDDELALCILDHLRHETRKGIVPVCSTFYHQLTRRYNCDAAYIDKVIDVAIEFGLLGVAGETDAKNPSASQ